MHTNMGDVYRSTEAVAIPTSFIDMFYDKLKSAWLNTPNIKHVASPLTSILNSVSPPLDIIIGIRSTAPVNILMNAAVPDAIPNPLRILTNRPMLPHMHPAMKISIYPDLFCNFVMK